MKTYDTLAFKSRKQALKAEKEIRDYFKSIIAESKVIKGKDERGNFGYQVSYQLIN